MPTKAECFGLVFVEAQASGLPVVACNVGGVGEVVREGETGLFVPPDDVRALERAIAVLVENSVLRHRLGHRGRAVAEERFDARKYAARTSIIAQEILQAATAARSKKSR